MVRSSGLCPRVPPDASRRSVRPMGALGLSTGIGCTASQPFATIGNVVTLETLQQRRAELLELAQRRGARAVWVFGSVARGESTPSSDVDFLVEFEPGRSLLDQVHLIDEFGALLGIRVDVVARGGLLDRDDHILAEAVPL